MSTKKILLIIIAIALITAIVLAAILLLNQDDTKVISKLNQDDTKNGLSPILGPIELPKAFHWDDIENLLYFVDVYQSKIHKYDPARKTHVSATVGAEPIAFVIPVANTDDKFIISYGNVLLIVTWDKTSPQINGHKLFALIGQNVYRANEGKVSPTGMLFVGTHSPFLSNGNVQEHKAALFGFYPNGTSKLLLDSVTISNGMTWSRDGKIFYYIDSLAYTVEAIDYIHETESLGVRNVIFDFKKSSILGVPDGMTIDKNENLWVTSFGGHKVICIDPKSGHLKQEIDVDALQVTSAIFAGPNLNDFYVSTGAYRLQDKKNEFNHSGYIFEALDFSVSGRAPSVPFNVDKRFLI